MRAVAPLSATCPPFGAKKNWGKKPPPKPRHPTSLHDGGLDDLYSQVRNYLTLHSPELTPMSNAQNFETAIEAAWMPGHDHIRHHRRKTRRDRRHAGRELDSWQATRSPKKNGKIGDWHVNQLGQKAVLLGFRIKDIGTARRRPAGSGWWEQVR